MSWGSSILVIIAVSLVGAVSLCQTSNHGWFVCLAWDSHFYRFPDIAVMATDTSIRTEPLLTIRQSASLLLVSIFNIFTDFKISFLKYHKDVINCCYI